MADAPTFEWVCDELERSSALDRLEARGTVRLALKESGLESRSVTVEQMLVVIERVLPEELSLRGIDDSTRLCARIALGLKDAGLSAAQSRGTDPDQIFGRLGR